MLFHLGHAFEVGHFVLLSSFKRWLEVGNVDLIVGDNFGHGLVTANVRDTHAWVSVQVVVE